MWCDNTKEPLAAMLRPGNAAPNDTDDHLELLEQAVFAVPAEYRLGHEEGDDPARVVHLVLVRADSAGATHRFVEALDRANFEYSIGFPISGPVRDALLMAQEEDWVGAVETDGELRDGAEVIELTGLVHLEGWPTDMRVICRRQHPHPGAQLSLFDIHAGWRHTCFITGTPGPNRRPRAASPGPRPSRGPGALLEGMRSGQPALRGVLPQPGLGGQPRRRVPLPWSQHLCFDGALAKAEPKTMRYRVLHVAAILVRRQRHLVLRLDETGHGRANWPPPSPDCGRRSRSGRVPAPDPEAIPQGVTTQDRPSDRDASRPR